MVAQNCACVHARTAKSKSHQSFFKQIFDKNRVYKAYKVIAYSTPLVEP